MAGSSVVPLLGEFVARHPGILVDISLSDTLEDVAGGRADVAIRFGPLADSPLTARKLGETGRTIVASPEYLARVGMPALPEDLHAHNCLNFNFRRAEPVWPFRRDGRDYALPVGGNIEANNGETWSSSRLPASASSGSGAAHVEDHVAAGRLVALLEPFNPGDPRGYPRPVCRRRHPSGARARVRRFPGGAIGRAILTADRGEGMPSISRSRPGRSYSSHSCSPVTTSA